MLKLTHDWALLVVRYKAHFFILSINSSATLYFTLTQPYVGPRRGSWSLWFWWGFFDIRRRALRSMMMSDESAAAFRFINYRRSFLCPFWGLNWLRYRGSPCRGPIDHLGRVLGSLRRTHRRKLRKSRVNLLYDGCSLRRKRSFWGFQCMTK